MKHSATVSVYLPGGMRVDILPRRNIVSFRGVNIVCTSLYSMADRLSAWLWPKGGRATR